MRTWFIPTLGALLVAGAAGAEDGKVQFETYCSACHAPDGTGANQGQFPPLAQSAWVQGKADRMLQVVLYGLIGEITVPSPHAANPTYNLAMPPHGAQLTDEQIAAITTYVRQSFGNKEEAVTVAMVQEQRKSSGERGMWTAEDLLNRYPLDTKGASPAEVPAGAVPIKDLLSNVYEGSWSNLPDFTQLKSLAVEEEKRGRISSMQAGKDQNFGIVWQGKLPVANDGTYSFRLDSDDGSRVVIDGKTVVEINSSGPMGRAQEGKAQLAKGDRAIRIEYYNQSGPHGISLAMAGPGISGWLPLSEEVHQGGAAGGAVGIPIVPPANEAVIYRNFIEGTTPRAIGVGYFGGVNLAFSADTMSLDLLWTGNFMDGKRHWVDRGQGNQPPAGERVIKVNGGPAFATLESQPSAWPGDYEEALKPHFNGYKFNKRQEPTFYYTLGGLKIEDKPAPLIGGNKFGMQRAITITVSGNAPARMFFRAASGLAVKDLGGNSFSLGDQGTVEVGRGTVGTPFVRHDNELIIPLNLKKGDNLINLRYSWN